MIDSAAYDLQSYILGSPPTLESIISYRTIEDNLDYLNLEEGQITRLRGFTSTTIFQMSGKSFTPNSILTSVVPEQVKMLFVIPPGSHIFPFVHQDSMDESEILLPHGVRIVYKQTLSLDQHSETVDSNAVYGRPDLVKDIHVFQVLIES